MILVGNQLDAQFFFICLFKSSTCFEQLCAHPQEDNCINPYPANVENTVSS